MDSKLIQNITESRLTYLDENGEENFIDFALCYKNYLKRYLSPENLAEIKNNKTDEELEKYIERRKAWREIAVRNILGARVESQAWRSSVPYIEFYTDPPTLFEFTEQEDFQKIRWAIEKAGWKTFDLS